MVVEVALIDVQAGKEDEFAAAYVEVQEHLATAPGCVSATMMRGVESPSRFVGVVRWESPEAHLTNFRNTPRYERYAARLGRLLAGPPVVEHFTVVDGAPSL